MPQPTCWLWPIATPGKAGSPAPITSHPGADQMNNVTQRRFGDSTMGIIGQQGVPGARQLAGNRPVVASLNARLRREFQAIVAARQIAQKIRRQAV